VIGLGGHVRVGAEDNPSVSPGHLADSNAQWVEKIMRIAGEQGRDIADPVDAREIIGVAPA
jgi:3-keto-5-aminohexanoate cleavage enzyme